MGLSPAAALLQKLVRCDTTNPPGNEARAAEILREWLKERGIGSEIIEVAPGRANLVARMTFGGPGPRLVLNAHLDVVPAGEGWRGDPRSGAIVDGRLYGRGAADAKGPLAAMAGALATMNELGTAGGEVILAAVADEEGASAGTRHLLRELKADVAIVGEPTDLKVVTCHKGSVRPVVEIQGRAAHAAQPAAGANAVLGMGRLLAMVEEHGRELEAQVHPLVGPPTIVPVLVAGGEALNMVPERCRVTFDRRLTPGEQEDEVLASFGEMLERFNHEEEGLTARLVELAPSTGGPSEMNADDPLVKTCVAALQGIGQAGELSGMQVNCDMSHFRGAGMPAVVYGPGSPSQMHVVDESIGLEDLERGQEGYLAMARAFLEGGRR
jgi:acetylornithine deacetylase/succinyl-diaminopimelate desuccinylase family protein